MVDNQISELITEKVGAFHYLLNYDFFKKNNICIDLRYITQKHKYDNLDLDTYQIVLNDFLEKTDIEVVDNLVDYLYERLMKKITD